MITYDPEKKVSPNDNEVEIEFNNNICESIINYKDSNIIILDNILSNDECDKIKEMTNDNYIKKRNKQCLKFSNLSRIIEQRCNNHLLQINSDWEFKEININWRLVKCDTNSILNKHFDSVYVKSVDYKSIYTIMIYLEDSDGDIKFDNIQVSPKKGRVVIFDQKLLHEGLSNNQIKYFIRSELMYSRIIPIESINDRKAIELYNNAIKLINIDNHKARQLEEEAFIMSPLLEDTILNC